jgi:ATP-dependent protease ClpP protease subunit
MIHRVAGNVVPPATAIKLKNLVDSVVADDARLEEIYKKEFKIPGEKIAALDYRDWFISAQEALDFGIVHNNDDFAPAVGAKMFNI